VGAGLALPLFALVGLLRGPRRVVRTRGDTA
jgi:hypothetical protein